MTVDGSRSLVIIAPSDFDTPTTDRPGPSISLMLKDAPRPKEHLHGVGQIGVSQKRADFPRNNAAALFSALFASPTPMDGR
eukprot:3372351-Pyramimonas_sp.AAC.1